MRTFGTYIVELLAANSVDLVFGIPGVHTVELYRGLEGSPIRHVTPRHEQGAGFMADGYARVSGKPGVCFIISGPGLTNIATAMGQAYGDSIPMLVISAVNSVGAMGSGAGHLHELPDQRLLMRQVSAFSHTVLDMAEFEVALARAFAIFASARPRPVHIEIPVELLGRDSHALGPVRRFALPSGPAASGAAIADVIALLSGARRPLIIAGGGAARTGADIRHLAEALDAPVLMTINGRGILPSHHPLALPISAASPAAIELMGQADVLLAVGTELGPTDFEDRLRDRSVFPGKLIRIDIDPEQAMRGLLADLTIVADARQAVEQIKAGISTVAARGSAQHVKAARSAVGAAASNRQIAGLALLEALRDAAPGTVIVGDSNQPVYAGCLAFAADTPMSFFSSATGYGTLGYGLPAAIGAKLADPARPVICVIGDGGLQFSLSEMATATEIAANITLLVWNNDGYGEIKSYMQAAGITPLGVDIYTPDFQKLALAFGWHTEKLGGPSDLGCLLAAARQRSGPTLIELDEVSYVAALSGTQLP